LQQDKPVNYQLAASHARACAPVQVQEVVMTVKQQNQLVVQQVVGFPFAH
jgi:hypothetical protein